MAVVVQKFGGTSVGSIERIFASAKIVEKEVLKGNTVVVVVSAMSGTTDKLIELTKEISKTPYGAGLAEYDAVISTGEQISAGLFVMALQSMGLTARSWQGWQIPIQTNKIHSKAFVEHINTQKILISLAQGEIAVVTGFQGITKDDKITTLGRGGSDTTAVALAAALKAVRCDIYTDVEGIYSSDPRVINKARKIEQISYDEMLELASLGSKVLHTRSVAIAKKFNVDLHVLSSFEEKKGTQIMNEDKIIEKYQVTGIAISNNESRITIDAQQINKLEYAKLFNPLTTSHISLDMLTKCNGELSFNVVNSEIDVALQLLLSTNLIDESNIKKEEVCKISLVGLGIKSNLEILQKIYDCLSEKAIEIIALVTSEIRISLLVKKEYASLAANTLHAVFDLDYN